jgi:hypothetical protein
VCELRCVSDNGAGGGVWQATDPGATHLSRLEEHTLDRVDADEPRVAVARARRLIWPLEPRIVRAAWPFEPRREQAEADGRRMAVLVVPFLQRVCLRALLHLHLEKAADVSVRDHLALASERLRLALHVREEGNGLVVCLCPVVHALCSQPRRHELVHHEQPRRYDETAAALVERLDRRTRVAPRVLGVQLVLVHREHHGL